MRKSLFMIFIINFILMQPMNAPASTNDLFQSFLFCKQDFSNRFGIILREAKEPLAKYLWDRLSDQTKIMIKNYNNAHPMAQGLRDKLMQDMNTILAGECIYEENRFHHISLSDNLQNLIQQKPTGNDLIRLNRLLLLEAYPQDAGRGGIFRIIGEVTVYLGFPLFSSRSKIVAHDLMTDDSYLIMKSVIKGFGNFCVSLDRALVYNLPCHFQYLPKNKEFPYNVYCLAILKCRGGNTLMYGISDFPEKSSGWLNINIDDPCEDVMNIIMDFIPPEFDRRKPLKERRLLPNDTGKKFFPEEESGPEKQDLRIRIKP